MGCIADGVKVCVSHHLVEDVSPRGLYIFMKRVELDTVTELGLYLDCMWLFSILAKVQSMDPQSFLLNS